MKTNTVIEITYKKVKQSPSVTAHLKNQIHKLARHFGHIISCHVILKQQLATKTNQGLFDTNIILHATDCKFVAKSKLHPNLYSSIADAMNGLQRQLKHRMRNRQNHHSHKEQVQNGVICKIHHDNKFGFIENTEGEEFYFNDAHVTKKNFNNLKIGQEIAFIEKQTSKGLQASKIRIKKNKS